MVKKIVGHPLLVINKVYTYTQWAGQAHFGQKAIKANFALKTGWNAPLYFLKTALHRSGTPNFLTAYSPI